MHFQPDPGLEDFRAEVRAFIQEALPIDIAARIRRGFHPAKRDMQFWMRALNEKGWVVPGWPVEYGGTGWSPLQRHVFEEELIGADAPPRSFYGLNLIGPVIYTFGSAEQKQRFLPGMLTETFWCQGFSEPESGSDLASLKTSAVREGDEYVVNGQKIWTTEAHYADWIFALVRTDTSVSKQRGISFLLIDLSTPGVTVRPIRTMDGQANVNEVFFDAVRVPAANLVGQEGMGWTYAKFLLTNERTVSAEVPSSKRDLARLKTLACEAVNGRRIIDDPGFALRLAQLEIELLALEFSVLRVLGEPQGTANSSVASVLKVRGSEIRQRVAGLTLEVLGPYGLIRYDEHEPNRLPGPAFAPGVMATFLYRRAATIYGGANEVQRNIIAKSVLGLADS